MMTSTSEEGLTPNQLRDRDEHAAALLRFGGVTPKPKRASMSAADVTGLGFLCMVCYDPAVRKHLGTYLCGDCYLEIVKGKVRNQNIDSMGGGCAVPDDSSPSCENGVRAMEDGR
jgi:hypothetical protein